MDSEDATAEKGRKMAMPALLDETKRMLEVLFVYTLRVVTICYTRTAVRIFIVLVAYTSAKPLSVWGVEKLEKERSVVRLEEIALLVRSRLVDVA